MRLTESILRNLKESVSAMDIANEIMNININPSEWNNASQSERDAMVYEPLKSIVRKYRKELVDDYYYINTMFSEFEFVAIELLDTTYSTYLTNNRIEELNKLAKVASNINNSLNLLDIIK